MKIAANAPGVRALAVACALAAVSCAPARGRGLQPLSASRFNGTWVMLEHPYQGELKLWAVNEHTLRVEFAGAYTYGTAGGSMADTSEGTGSATVRGETASFVPDRSDAECTITLRLRGRGWMRADQSGACFGRYVKAAGRYQRISRDRPWFGAPNPQG
ncbi:MAG TPA: hypothetical protein VHG08_00570 [Longimicrobium sp.]|nr:hypothetical protein [Longimicrobium sp.]